MGVTEYNTPSQAKSNMVPIWIWGAGVRFEIHTRLKLTTQSSFYLGIALDLNSMIVHIVKITTSESPN